MGNYGCDAENDNTPVKFENKAWKTTGVRGKTAVHP